MGGIFFLKIRRYNGRNNKTEKKVQNMAEIQPFTKAQERFLRSLKTPVGVQSFLDALPYHHAGTAFSPKKVLEEGTAHCLEGAIFAAAALRYQGRPPLLLDLEAEADSDHVLALYKENGAWGSIGISNFSGLRFRPAIYRSIRELALSYVNDYFNLRRQRTLRRYSNPVSLKKFDRQHWMTTDGPVWFIAEHLCEIPHIELMTKKMLKNLPPVDQRSFLAGKVGMTKK